MDICVLTDRYPPHQQGGAEVIAANLAEAYAARGHEVTVITGVEHKEDAGYRRQNGVEVWAIAVPTFQPLRSYYGIYHPVAVRKIASIFKCHDFDAVHAHNLEQFLSYHALKLAKDPTTKVILTYHGTMSVEYGKLVPDEVPEYGDTSPSAYRVSWWEQFKDQKVFYFPLRNRLNRAYLNKYVDVGVSVSRALHTALTVNGIRSQQVIHNGIDVEPYDEADPASFENEFGLDDEHIVLYGGRVGYYKGGEHLARAFARVAESREDVRLVVTGSRTEFVNRMRELAGPHGDSILATGWLDEKMLRSAYKAATVVATPSIYLDPFPTVNLEAMAAGTAVISTCYGGSSELVVDGETGIIVNPRNVSAFADALSNLVLDPERSRQYGQNGKQRVVTEFALDDQVEAYLDILERERRVASTVN
jgi:glycosyltransferase involved in cell wall biosynthesis